jgi:hypothetical protein
MKQIKKSKKNIKKSQFQPQPSKVIIIIFFNLANKQQKQQQHPQQRWKVVEHRSARESLLTTKLSFFKHLDERARTTTINSRVHSK